MNEFGYVPVDAGRVMSADISVVVQGPLYRTDGGRPNIDVCLDAVKRVLPDAEIIVATWSDEDVAGVRAHKVVAIDDPGGWPDIGGNVINLQRQDRSTRAGLALATRRWTLKMRSDIILEHAGFLRRLLHGQRVPAECRLFESPVAALTLYSRDPARAPALFHPSDIIQFGLTEDMKAFWSGTPFRSSDVLGEDPRFGLIRGWLGFTRQRLVPEQALMLRWLASNGLSASLSSPTAVSVEGAQMSEQMLLANFRLMDARDAGVLIPPHLLRSRVAIATVYRSSEVERIAWQAFEQPRRRLLAIWLRKYVLFATSGYWWVVAGHLLLRRMAPGLVAPLRRAYARALLGNVFRGGLGGPKQTPSS